MPTKLRRVHPVTSRLRIAFGGSSFVFFGIGAALMSWLVLPLVWLPGTSLTARQKRCQRFAAWMFGVFHDYMRLLGLLNYSWRSALAQYPLLAEPKSPVVVVANHPTLIDTTAILACMKTGCCLTAPHLSRRLLLRPTFYFCGYILLRDNGLSEQAKALNEAERRLREGHSLLVFPEGTRSPLGEPTSLGTFQRGIFGLAEKTGTPILPVVIRVWPRVLTGHTPWHDLADQSTRYEVEPLEPMSPSDYAGGRGAGRELARRVRERIQEHLVLPDVRRKALEA